MKRHALEVDVFTEKGKRGAGFLLVERKDVSCMVGIAVQLGQGVLDAPIHNGDASLAALCGAARNLYHAFLKINVSPLYKLLGGRRMMS